jgi:leader peptidase (prepilin peptidase)/N-methyltransferase
MAESSFFLCGVIHISVRGCHWEFLNVCIYRLPDHESVVFPASHCRACLRMLSWYENVPLLSYLLQHGKCRTCGARFVSLFWIELLTAFLSIALVFHFGLTFITAGYLLFVAALVDGHVHRLGPSDYS